MKLYQSSILITILPSLVCACSAPAAPAEPLRAATTAGGARLVQLSPGAPGLSLATSREKELLQPAGENDAISTLLTGDALFFKSNEKGGFLQVRVEGDFECAKDCETQEGFRCMKDRAESRAIEPGGIVSLCFHRPGRYGVTVVGGERVLRGFVEVRER